MKIYKIYNTIINDQYHIQNFDYNLNKHINNPYHIITFLHLLHNVNFNLIKNNILILLKILCNQYFFHFNYVLKIMFFYFKKYCMIIFYLLVFNLKIIPLILLYIFFLHLFLINMDHIYDIIMHLLIHILITKYFQYFNYF